MTDSKKNMILVVASLVVFLLLLEGGLRFAGWAFMQMQEQRNRKALQSKEAVRILCLGESTTALGGPHAYPRQLQDLLNKGSDGKTFSVINKGVPGITTAEIIARLDDMLGRYEPHIVIAMMGINDDDDDAQSWEEELLARSHVFRLFQLIGRHIVERMPFTRAAREKVLFERFMQSWEQAIDGNQQQAEQLFKEQLAHSPNDVQSYGELASWHTLNGQYDRALQVLQEAEQKFPGHEDIILHRGTVYMIQGKWEEAAREYYQFVQITEYNDDAYLGLAWSWMQLGKYEAAEEILRQNIQLNPTDVAYGALILCYQKQGKKFVADKYRRLAELRRVRTLLPMTEENYRELYRRVQARGIPLIVVQYPRRDVNLLRAIFSAEDQVFFVDNEASFNAAVQKDGYEALFINNFAGDFGHATPLGNWILAENVAAGVRQLLTTF